MEQVIHIFGGGTMSDVRAHLALCAPAFGTTAKVLQNMFTAEIEKQKLPYKVQLHLTSMAGGHLRTNEDVKQKVQRLLEDPATKCIVMNAALCDFEGTIEEVQSGKSAPRLESRGASPTMHLTPSEKIIGIIRKERKDVFAVGFKTTSFEEEGVLYTKALRLLKQNSLNLVFGNDIGNKKQCIVAPEESRYAHELTREGALQMLVKMSLSRMQNSFTRSTLIDAPLVPWSGSEVCENLRAVVDYCIQKGAYKPFLGKTAGHFAQRLTSGSVLTSVRKSNFNQLHEVGMVKIEYEGLDKVIAHGARPSVGGQSQRIIFDTHKDVECIVHFHCPPKKGSIFEEQNAPQWPYECGSHQCGRNTSDHLMPFELSGGHRLLAVYLKDHGPNIVFDSKTPAHLVIEFIEKHFDLSQKTGGMLQEERLVGAAV